MAPTEAPATTPPTWLASLRCGHIIRIPDGPVQPLVHCPECGQPSPVMLAMRQ